MDDLPPIDEHTATLEGALEHARRQVGTVAATQATIPVQALIDRPDGVAAEHLRWDETLATGGYAARRLARDTIIRIADLVGDACVNLQLFNAAEPFERLNPPDTVKVQWQAYPAAGTVLLSGQGRALATIVADSSGRHDALCGHANRRAHEVRFGHGGIHGPAPATRDLLALGAARFGLTRRDLGAGLNLFKGVRVAADGALCFDGAPVGSTTVDLRLELDLIVVVANAPHPLDARPAATGGPARVTAWVAPRPRTDPFRSSTPERQRAFENTDDYLLGATR